MTTSCNFLFISFTLNATVGFSSARANYFVSSEFCIREFFTFNKESGKFQKNFLCQSILATFYSHLLYSTKKGYRFKHFLVFPYGPLTYLVAVRNNDDGIGYNKGKKEGMRRAPFFSWCKKRK